MNFRVFCKLLTYDFPGNDVIILTSLYTTFFSQFTCLVSGVHYSADANVLNKEKNTPLHVALYNIKNSLEGSDRIIKRNCDIARLLLLYGAQLSKKQLEDKKINLNSILIVAITTGAIELVKFTLDAGADVNYKSAFGDAPLHIIARRMTDESLSLPILKLLLDYNADINRVNENKSTVLEVWAEANMLKKNVTSDMINTISECMKTKSNKHHRK